MCWKSHNIAEAVEEIGERTVIFAIDIAEVALVFVTRFEMPLQRMRSLVSVVIDVTNDVFAMLANMPGCALFRFNRLKEFSKRFIQPLLCLECKFEIFGFALESAGQQGS